MRRETDYQGPKSPPKKHKKRKLLLIPDVAPPPVTSKESNREGESDGFIMQDGETSGQQENFLMFSLFFCLARCASWQIGTG